MNTISKCENPDCELGWVYGKYISSKIVTNRDGIEKKIDTEYEGVTPCPVCDPVRAALVQGAESSEELQESLQSRSVTKRLANYRSVEDSKTRVL